MRIRPFIAVLPLLLLAACGTEPEVAVNSSPTGQVYGPATPAATVAGTAIPAAQLPSASGKFGEKPILTFPTTPPPPNLQRATISEGTGTEVKTGDTVIVNYLGQVWGGATAFDNSYDEGKSAFDFAIGTEAVVSGWDAGLVGVKAGSRVMLTLSPSDGYGAKGNEGAGIKGTDTLVFVIDVVATLSKDQMGQADAVVQPETADLPIINGALGAIPTGSTIPDGTTEPTEVTTTVIAEGTGAPVVDAPVYLQFAAYGYDGVQQGATWDSSGPSKVETLADIPELAGLIGIPVGSRVLLQIPGTAELPATASAEAQPASPAAIFVMDIIYQ